MKLKWKPSHGQRVTSYQCTWLSKDGHVWSGRKHRSVDKAFADFVSERLLDNVKRAYIRVWYTTPTGRKNVVEEVIWPSDRAGQANRALARDVGPTDA